ncbi:MAG: ABC transporter permease [Puniceicoccales bacterium]|jgi:ABC-type transport system involved in multi-copper enzyme maturation permease subunit|nr:ABC transporter permease [Puniceicoccales bacterium]
MSMSAPTSHLFAAPRESFRRVRHIAGNTFREASRQKFFAFVVVLASALALSGLFLRVFSFGMSELRFVADFGFGGIFLFGSILGIVMTAQLFFAELDNRTVLTLLARPVRRWEFIAGKFFGMWLLLGVFVAATGGVLAALLQTRSLELASLAAETGAPAPWFSAGGLGVFLVLQWVRLGVVAALTLFVCAFARSFLYAVVVSALAVLVCQLRGFGALATTSTGGATGDAPSLPLRLAGNALVLVPDLQVFDLGVPLALEPAGVAGEVLRSAALSGLVFTAAPLALAAWIFSDREV